MKNITNTLNGFTNTWKTKIVDLYHDIKDSKEITQYYKEHQIEQQNIKLHLAVFNEPFLSLILKGKKTVESRFSINRIAPFDRVKNGDIIFLKKSGGPITGAVIVGQCYYFHCPSEKEMNDIKHDFNEKISANAVDNFWESRTKANYITLIEIAKTKSLKPFYIEKRDRLGWVPINP